MSSQNYSDRDADIDLMGLFRAIWRRKLTVAGFTLGLAAAGLVISTVIPPKYQAETRLLIESRVPEFSQNKDTQSAAPAADNPYDEAGVLSQVQVLQSVDLIKAVSRKLQLDKVAELDPSGNPSILTDVMVLLGLVANPLDTPPEERVVQEFTKKLLVYQVEKSRVIAIQFSSKDPQLAAAIPNAMAEIYQSLQSGAKLTDNEDATKWLEPEIANLRDKVSQAEAKVAEYRSNAGLLKTGEQTTFVTQQLNDISLELARVRGDRANAEAKAEAVRNALSSGGDVDTLAAVVQSPMIQRLKESQSTMQAQLADLSTTHLEGHPKLKAVRAQLAGIRQQIASETRKVLASLESDATTSRLRENQLIGQLNALKADTAKAGEQEVGLKALEREAASQRQLLETYLARYREAASRQDSKATPADARVVSNALVPTLPYFPKIVPITAISGVAGFVFSAVGIMLSELLSGRAMRPVVSTRRREDDEWAGFDPVPETVNVANTQAASAVPQQVAEPRPAAIATVATETLRKAEPVSLDPSLRSSGQSLAGLALEIGTAQERKTKLQADQERARTIAAETLAALETRQMNSAQSANNDELDVGAMEEAADAFLDDDFSVSSVSQYLLERDVPLVVCVSPTDAGATASVMLVRALSENGGRVVLIDMTGTGVPTRLMADSPRLPGITDLLSGRAAFGDTIHVDRLSDAHVIPLGMADPAGAMKSFGRLGMIVDALTRAYDIVVVECGDANAQAVRMLMRDQDADIVICVGSADKALIEDEVGRFFDVGYKDIVLMMGPPESRPVNRRRRA